MSRLEELVSNLPVIREYRSKELRRDADYRLRQNIADSLKAQRRRLTSMQRDMVSAGRLRELPEVERAVGRLQLLIDRIRTASYGYAPFYDAQEIREEELDRLIAFDEAITRQIPVIEERIDALADALHDADTFATAVSDLLEALDELRSQYDRREEAISYLGAEGSPSSTDEAEETDR
ncbi:MAG: hypothetical protein D6775_11125 [Caldilineae bacterium]|nr:MAG: hypothetical protein D6775_11125 [Caldilineae bacterium]